MTVVRVMRGVPLAGDAILIFMFCDDGKEYEKHESEADASNVPVESGRASYARRQQMNGSTVKHKNRQQMSA